MKCGGFFCAPANRCKLACIRGGGHKKSTVCRRQGCAGFPHSAWAVFPATAGMPEAKSCLLRCRKAEPQSCTLAVTLAAQSCLPEPHSSPNNQFRSENYPLSRTKHQKITFPFGKTTHFPDKHSYFGYRFMQIWSCTPNLHKMEDSMSSVNFSLFLTDS